MSFVQPWAENRKNMLNKAVDFSWSPASLSDDRLVVLLRQLADDELWEGFESELNRRTLTVYQLQQEAIRLDSTTASGHWEVTEGGLFQFGHSKDHRPDLPQVKVMMSTLEPMGMPLVTTIEPGNYADDPLYIPAMERVKKSLQQDGLLYIGDAKMAAIQTRYEIQQKNDFYLCPLPQKQLSKEELKELIKPVLTGEQALIRVTKVQSEEEEVQFEGYERLVEFTYEENGKTHSWQERELIVKSIPLAWSKQEKLHERVKKAQEELSSLNERGRGKKRYTEKEELHQRVSAILDENKVNELLKVEYEEKVTEKKIRAHGQNPARTERSSEWVVQVQQNEEAIEQAIQQEGWRVYATNAPEERLPFAQAIPTYRASQSIENGFSRLKNAPLSLLPSYLQNPAHVKGLIRLLCLGLRVLTLLEFVVRRNLAKEGKKVSGIYAGNPARSTARPSAELLLKAFEGLTLTLLF